MRNAFVNLIGIACLALVLRTWVAIGLVAPVFVSGDSMAPRLCGPHVSTTCPRCNATTAVGFAYLPTTRQTSCAHCGESVGLNAPQQRGDRLLIDRTAYQWRSPQRWEPIVFHCPSGNRLCVKRVAGLPGETVSIRDGDLFIDGRRHVKSLPEQRRVRQPLPSRDLQYAGSNPATDAQSYNTGLSRELNTVNDFFLSVRVRAQGAGALVVRGTTLGQAWQLGMLPDSRRLLIEGIANEAIETPLPPEVRRSLRRNVILLEISTFDRQLLVAIDQYVLARAPFPESELAATSQISMPPQLAVEQLAAELEDFQLYRDLDYTSAIVGLPPGTQEAWQLGENEWFVLGDNSPVSIDSRVWGPIPGRLLIGKPLGVY